MKLFSRNKSDKVSVLSDMREKQRQYEALVSAYHKDLYRYAYWLIQDQHIAEDVVQETFLRAWKSLDSLVDAKAAKSWLITILRRENARRFERRQFDYSEYDEPNILDKSTDIEDDTEQYWLNRQINKLPLEYREPLVLQVVAGFSGDEIAGLLDLNKNTVMTRLFRARNMLKEALDNNSTLERSANG